MMKRDRSSKRILDPSLTQNEFRTSVIGWRRLQWILGTAHSIYPAIRRHAISSPHQAIRVLDVASGSGCHIPALLKKAKRDGLSIDFTAMDCNERNIDHQLEFIETSQISWNPIVRDCLLAQLPTGYDVVICTTFIHELDANQLFRLLQSMQSATDGPIIVTDFQRTRITLASLAIASKCISKSKVLCRDICECVRSSHTRAEFKQIAQEALARPICIRQSLPCCYVATVEQIVDKEPSLDVGQFAVTG